jgi:uncharacterized protein
MEDSSRGTEDGSRPPKISVDGDRIAEFCRKWNITELAFFGSVLRDDFRPDSDVDVLVTFTRDSTWTLFDIAHIQDELSELLGRKADLIERNAVEHSENYIRRRHILESLRPIYVAG